MKHTPGEWEILWGGQPNFDGSEILTIYRKGHKIGDRALIIAMICDKGHLEDHDKANASLIAASPDLLEVAEKVRDKPKEALKIMEKNGFVIDNLEDRWQKLAFTFYTIIVESAISAEEAIAKAEGQD